MTTKLFTLCALFSFLVLGCGIEDNPNVTAEPNLQLGAISGTVRYQGVIPNGAVLYGVAALNSSSSTNGQFTSINSFKLPHTFVFHGLKPGAYFVGFYLGDQPDPSTAVCPEWSQAAADAPKGTYLGVDPKATKPVLVEVKAGYITEGIEITLVGGSNSSPGVKTPKKTDPKTTPPTPSSKPNISGTVTYSGTVSTGDVLRGFLFDNPSFSGMPKKMYQISPKFPQKYSIQDVADGTYYVAFYLDVNGDNPFGAGKEDLKGAYLGAGNTPAKVTVSGGQGVSNIDIQIGSK